MRIKRWLSLLFGAATMCAGGIAQAQNPAEGFTAPGSASLRAGTGNPYPAFEASPGGFQPLYSTNVPGNLAPTLPGEFQPYPQISPFERPGTNQSFNLDGLWFHRHMATRRSYFFSTDVIWTFTRRPVNHIMGSRNTQPIDAGTGLPSRNPDTGVEYEGVSPFDPRDEEITAAIIAFTPLPVPQAFPWRKFGEMFPGETQSLGMRLRGGFENEDGTGISVTGWWSSQTDREYFRGDSDFLDPFVPGAGNISTLSVLTGGIPLDNGLPYRQQIVNAPLTFFEVPGRLGSTVPYDEFFQTKIGESAFGANVSFTLSPWFERKNVTLRPMVGARYINIGEDFQFLGRDSGRSYGEVADPLDRDFTDTGATRGIVNSPPLFGQQTLAAFVGFVSPQVNYGRPEQTITAGANGPYVSTMQADATTNLAGPEIGIRYDFGSGKSFKIWGQTNFGLLANHERVEIRGENIGDLFRDQVAGLILPLGIVGSPVGGPFPEDTRFTDSETHTHVSPMLETGINMEAKVFGRVPLLRELAIFQAANLNLGYNFLLVGEVARPTDSIDWKGLPLFPSVSIRRTQWFQHQWNAGLSWSW